MTDLQTLPGVLKHLKNECQCYFTACNETFTGIPVYQHERPPAGIQGGGVHVTQLLVLEK